MSKKILWFWLLAAVSCGANALAGSSVGLDGTWMLDPKATEAYIKGVSQIENPDQVAEAIGMATPLLTLLVYEFHGDSANVRTFNGIGKEKDYKCLSTGEKILCASTTAPASEDDTFSVTVLNTKAIKISYPHSPELSYLVWGRVTLDPNETAPEFAQALAKEWKVPFKNIMKVLHARASPIGPAVH